MSHYYDPKTGKPCHYQPKKKGGGLRPTTIADARKLGLLPSVSTILGALHKEKLVQKMMEKIILTMQQVVLKDDGYIHARDDAGLVADIKEAAFADWGAAQDLGTRIHKAIELNMGPAGLVPEDDLAPYVLPAVKAVNDLGLKVAASEAVVVNAAEGYAGTTDLVGWVEGKEAVLDFKSTKTTPGKPVEGWDSQVMQLAAYHHAYWGDLPRMVENERRAYNVYISTNEPGRVDVLKRTADELADGYEAFLHVCGIWRYLNNYDPRQK